MNLLMAVSQPHQQYTYTRTHFTSDTVVSSLVLRPVKLVSRKQVLESGECDKILKEINCSFLKNEKESSENVIIPDSQSIEISLRKKKLRNI